MSKSLWITNTGGLIEFWYGTEPPEYDKEDDEWWEVSDCHVAFDVLQSDFAGLFGIRPPGIGEIKVVKVRIEDDI